MFSYVMLGTNDLERAIRFYDPLMELLGHPKAGRNEEGASWGRSAKIIPSDCASAGPLTDNPPGLVMARWWR